MKLEKVHYGQWLMTSDTHRVAVGVTAMQCRWGKYYSLDIVGYTATLSTREPPNKRYTV